MSYPAMRYERLKESFNNGDKYVIVYESRHAHTEYWDGTTLEIFFASCLQLLKTLHSLNELGLWEEDDIPEIPSITMEEAEKLPNKKFQEFIKSVWDSYNASLERYNEDMEIRKTIKEAIDNDDSVLAYFILQQLDIFKNRYLQFVVLTSPSGD